MIAKVPSFDATGFKKALGRFPTGVTVAIAQNASGLAVGLTVSSFNSVSLAPPLVVWSLSASSSSLAAFETCERYVIHVLSADQLDLARQFSTGSRDDRFAGVELARCPNGSPRLATECAAWFECHNRRRYREGDHVVLIGEVEHCHHSAAMPLIYHSGGYDLTPLVV